MKIEKRKILSLGMLLVILAQFLVPNTAQAIHDDTRCSFIDNRSIKVTHFQSVNDIASFTLEVLGDNGTFIPLSGMEFRPFQIADGITPQFASVQGSEVPITVINQPSAPIGGSSNANKMRIYSATDPLTFSQYNTGSSPNFVHSLSSSNPATSTETTLRIDLHKDLIRPDGTFYIMLFKTIFSKPDVTAASTVFNSALTEDEKGNPHTGNCYVDIDPFKDFTFNTLSLQRTSTNTENTLSLSTGSVAGNNFENNGISMEDHNEEHRAQAPAQTTLSANFTPDEFFTEDISADHSFTVTVNNLSGSPLTIKGSLLGSTFTSFSIPKNTEQNKILTIPAGLAGGINQTLKLELLGSGSIAQSFTFNGQRDVIAADIPITRLRTGDMDGNNEVNFIDVLLYEIASNTAYTAISQLASITGLLIPGMKDAIETAASAATNARSYLFGKIFTP
jgi:hypothetical protein